MVLDAAKGIEPQTLKLFEVCRERNLPLVTFINKWDRPGRDPLELLDQVESQLSIVPTPVTWPVGIAGRSEEHTSELQSLMRNSYAVFCLKKNNTKHNASQDKRTTT